MTETEAALEARGVMTSIIEHQKTDEKFRKLALDRALAVEHMLPPALRRAHPAYDPDDTGLTAEHAASMNS
jgi:hypothetical protein